MTPELKLYQKKTRLLVGGLAMVAFIAGLIVMLIIGPNPDSIFRPFRSPLIFYSLGAAGLWLTGAFAWISLRGLTNPKPRVVLSEKGVVTDGFSGRFEAGWEEFSGYALIRGSIYVLKLRDREAFVSRQPVGRARQTAQALSEKFGSPFLIETGMLATDAETIRKALALRLQPEQP